MERMGLHGSYMGAHHEHEHELHESPYGPLLWPLPLPHPLLSLPPVAPPCTPSSAEQGLWRLGWTGQPAATHAQGARLQEYAYKEYVNREHC